MSINLATFPPGGLKCSPCTIKYLGSISYQRGYPVKLLTNLKKKLKRQTKQHRYSLRQNTSSSFIPFLLPFSSLSPSPCQISGLSCKRETLIWSEHLPLKLKVNSIQVRFALLSPQCGGVNGILTLLGRSSHIWNDTILYYIVL